MEAERKQQGKKTNSQHSLSLFEKFWKGLLAFALVLERTIARTHGVHLYILQDQIGCTEIPSLQKREIQKREKKERVGEEKKSFFRCKKKHKVQNCGVPFYIGHLCLFRRKFRRIFLDQVCFSLSFWSKSAKR